MSKSAGEAELEWQLKCAKVDKPEREYRFAPPRRWRFDFAWPPIKVAAEVEGGHYSGGHKRYAAADSDCEKANAAVMAGWRVLRFTPAMVERGEAIETIAAALGVTI